MVDIWAIAFFYFTSIGILLLLGSSFGCQNVGEEEQE
jgi:hypothetical protein